MRLTLRTLLAYMDDILEPADHEDLGKKIEASDFATELIHRSRDTVRRLRLGAPAVLAEDSDDVLETIDLGDANSVAEYLDNTLPPEQVADFERMCLEPGNGPDMHLAEVASCHHVLTMVLGEPADVDADLKSRMYSLPSQLASGQRLRIEPSHAAPSSSPPVAEPVSPAQAAAPIAPPVAQPASAVHAELPDYLREAAAAKRKSRNWAIAITLLVIGGLGAWLAKPTQEQPPAEVASSGAESFSDGELDSDVPDALAAGSLSDGAVASSAADEPAPAFDPNATAGEPAPAFVPGADTSLEPAPPFDASMASGEVAPVAQQGVAADMMPDGGNEAPDVTEIVESEGQPPEGVDLGGEVALADGADAAADGAPAVSLEGPSMDLAIDTAEIDASPFGREESPTLVASTPADPMPSELSPEGFDEADAEMVEDEEPAEPIRPQRIGSYPGNDDVLLIYNENQDAWIRMSARSPISTGDTLLTLPKFLTHVVLDDVNTYLSGGTRISMPLERISEMSDSRLDVEIVYGRALFNGGLEGHRIAVLVDDQLREFKLDESASLAVDVQRMFVPGNDYENQAAPTIATWYLTSGSVEWPTATGGTQTIRGQMIWKTMDGVDEIPEPVAELPEWIGREPMTDMERSAREDLAKELDVDRAVRIRLMELTDGKGLGRRREVRVLAAASGIYIGEFEPLVKALSDSDQSLAWSTHIHDLQQAMALSPDVAASVRQDFIDIRGESAAEDLFEMVVGYNGQQIGETREAVQIGALSQLLKRLDHESLDYRVLAIHNIREITGKDKGYRPDDPLKDRKQSLRRLWVEFESNELQPQR